MSSVRVISRASAFGRNHCGAEWMFRIAFFAKSGTVVRFFDAAQNQPTDTGGRFLCIDFLYVKEPFRVVLAKFPTKLISALGNRANATPFAIAYFTDFFDELSRNFIAVPRDDSRILIFRLGLPCFQLANGMQGSLQ